MDFELTGYTRSVIKHYQANWGNDYSVKRWEKGDMINRFPQFCILVFPPHENRNMWTYATCAMSGIKSQDDLELHLFSSVEDDSILELLTAVAYYHKTEHKLGLSHTVNFGRPWQDHSTCTYGFISLPYLDGPALEIGKDDRFGNTINFYWLIPITKEELQYKKQHGAEALEEIFDSQNFNYLNPNRKSLVTTPEMN